MDRNDRRSRNPTSRVGERKMRHASPGASRYRSQDFDETRRHQREGLSPAGRIRRHGEPGVAVDGTGRRVLVIREPRLRATRPIGPSASSFSTRSRRDVKDRKRENLRRDSGRIRAFEPKPRAADCEVLRRPRGRAETSPARGLRSMRIGLRPSDEDAWRQGIAGPSAIRSEKRRPARGDLAFHEAPTCARGRASSSSRRDPQEGWRRALAARAPRRGLRRWHAPERTRPRISRGRNGPDHAEASR